VASSARVAHVLSSYGLIHLKLCYQLGTDKASKLVFLYKLLNQKNVITSEMYYVYTLHCSNAIWLCFQELWTHKLYDFA